MKIIIAEQVINDDTDEISLCGKNLNDISALQNFSNLKYLALEENIIEDLQPLNSLFYLQTLYLCHNKVKDVTPLKNLQRLQKSLMENLLLTVQIKYVDY